MDAARERTSNAMEGMQNRTQDAMDKAKAVLHKDSKADAQESQHADWVAPNDDIENINLAASRFGCGGAAALCVALVLTWVA
mmetsp:Transcript_181459/g.576017  ORF Transcript_181459/g.576017 Transcript_181459/m.576017 type:complete len:82 (+) Transcript_181459:703-948(+)